MHLTIPQTADLIHRSRHTVHRLINDGTLKVVHNDGSLACPRFRQLITKASALACKRKMARPKR